MIIHTSDKSFPVASPRQVLELAGRVFDHRGMAAMTGHLDACFLQVRASK